METTEKMTEININNELYVLKSSIKKTEIAEENNMPFVIIRTYSAGVHMGYLKSKTYTLAGTIVELVKTRRIWYWSGAMSISQLALEGTKKSEECKFSVEIPSVELMAIEVVLVTKEAFENLTSVKIWKI